MSISLNTVISIIEKLIPPVLAESWDNVGLQVGDPGWPVNKIRVALDPASEVIENACSDGIDLLLTHHPLIFKPLKRIDLGTPQGALVEKAISHRMAIYAAHTNFDRLADGLNDILARKIELQELRSLEAAEETKSIDSEGKHGLGRIGSLKKAMPLDQLAHRVKSLLNLDYLRMAGRGDLVVKTVALCTGSGSGLLEDFLNCGAQVYISGDLRYHDARTVEESDLGLIDIGHFPSEHLMVEALSQRLEKVLKRENISAAVSACRVEKDPFKLI